MEIDLPLIKKFLGQMLDILSEFELKNIVHRDIKPDNILIDQDCNFKIADLGLSKQIQDNDTLITNLYMGTCGFIPPEFSNQTTNKSKGDIWSMGLTIYYLCSLQHPDDYLKSFHEKDYTNINAPQLKEKYKVYFNNIYTKMVIKDPERRFKASELKKLFDNDDKIQNIEKLDSSKVFIPTSMNKIYDNFNLAFNEGDFDKCRNILSQIDDDDFTKLFENHYTILEAKLLFFEGDYEKSNFLLNKYKISYFKDFPDFKIEYYRMKSELHLILERKNEDKEAVHVCKQLKESKSLQQIIQSKLIDLSKLMMLETELYEYYKNGSDNYKEALINFDKYLNKVIMEKSKLVPKIEIVRMKYMLANMCEKDKDYDKALQLYNESLNNLNEIEKIHNPIAIKAHYYYGKFILNLMKDEEYNERNSKFNEAIKHFKKAIELLGDSKNIKFYQPFVMMETCFLKSGLLGNYIELMLHGFSNCFQNLDLKELNINSLIMRNEYFNFLLIFRQYNKCKNSFYNLYKKLNSDGIPYLHKQKQLRYEFILLNNLLIASVNYEIYIKDSNL